MASRENVLKRRPVLLVFLFDQVGPIEQSEHRPVHRGIRRSIKSH